jgi:hypothetical protein
LNKIAEKFLLVAERYDNLAECEPDFNQAQDFRRLARHMKEEAAKLANVKDTDNGNDSAV